MSNGLDKEKVYAIFSAGFQTGSDVHRNGHLSIQQRGLFDEVMPFQFIVKRGPADSQKFGRTGSIALGLARGFRDFLLLDDFGGHSYRFRQGILRLFDQGFQKKGPR